MPAVNPRTRTVRGRALRPGIRGRWLPRPPDRVLGGSQHRAATVRESCCAATTGVRSTGSSTTSRRWPRTSNPVGPGCGRGGLDQGGTDPDATGTGQVREELAQAPVRGRPRQPARTTHRSVRTRSWPWPTRRRTNPGPGPSEADEAVATAHSQGRAALDQARAEADRMQAEARQQGRNRSCWPAGRRANGSWRPVTHNRVGPDDGPGTGTGRAG